MSMNNNSNQQNLCKQGCGFYGNAQSMDMCSKCYQNYLKTSNSQEGAPSTHPMTTSNQSPYGSGSNGGGRGSPQISSINDSSIYYHHHKLVESAVNNNRKRLAQSEIIESLHKVPKTTCKSKDSEQYAVETNQIVDMFVSSQGAPQQANVADQNLGPDDPDASPANSLRDNASGATTPIMKKPRRCEFCRRKVGLTGFDCRCGGHYCAVHRYSDKHSCTFDYQAHGQEQIKHQNPMICGSKIKKI